MEISSFHGNFHGPDGNFHFDQTGKWSSAFHFDPGDGNRWKRLWTPNRPIKHTTLQWYILYRVIPTNTWRHTQSARTDEDTWPWEPRFSHAVLGEEIPPRIQTTAKWWDRWRMSILWIVWTQRNERVFRGVPTSLHKAKAMAWFQLLSFTRTEWRKHCIRAEAQDLTLARRHELDFRFCKKLAILTLRFRISGRDLLSTWKPQ
ncbi:hypothetical protein R1sor_014960 [Riccia sorocarpa]|uniref:Uncharacterized protein n=1 Tax=Riccia sorocarpa TaxID=122646 RepID=A0ABD3HCQ6_9MARC